MSIPDRHHRLLQRLIDQAQPNTFEELQELMNSLVGATLPDIPEEEKSPEDQAFDLVDEAWERAPAKGRKLARQALEIWPDCIPAYEYLSTVEKSKQHAIAYLEKGVEIGQRLFGGEFMKKHVGHFWHISETRPYMRCLNNLAYHNVDAGNLSKAIVIWEDILRLNPADNQGARYGLLVALLRQRDLKTYRKYRKQYPEETTSMYFNDALANFIEQGAGASATLHLKSGAGTNSYVVPLLLHPAPPTVLPDSYTLFSPEEAIIYAAGAWQLWHEIPGAIEWLADVNTEHQTRSAGTPPVDRLSREMQELLFRDPFSPISPLQLRPDLKDEDVAHVPFVQFTRALLQRIHQAQALKLTLKGNLPRALVQSMYDLRLFPSKYVDDGGFKLLSETDFRELHIAHVICGIAKWIQKRKGKVSLTKKGLQLLQGSQALFYLEYMKIYMQQYNWAYTESWAKTTGQTGQAGCAFILYELIRQGDTPQHDTYYAKLYFQLLPHLVELYNDSPYSSARAQAESDVRYRFFRNFARMFGLVEFISEPESLYDSKTELIIRRSVLAGQLFEVRVAR